MTRGTGVTPPFKLMPLEFATLLSGTAKREYPPKDMPEKSLTVKYRILGPTQPAKGVNFFWDVFSAGKRPDTLVPPPSKGHFLLSGHIIQQSVCPVSTTHRPRDLVPWKLGGGKNKKEEREGGSRGRERKRKEKREKRREREEGREEGEKGQFLADQSRAVWWASLQRLVYTAGLPAACLRRESC